MKKDLLLLNRFIIYDTLCEPTYEQFERITEFNQLVTLLQNNPKFFRRSYRGLSDGTSIETDFEYTVKAITLCRNIHFAVEEIGLHCNSWKMPPALQQIVSAGRHRDISFYCTSQRASNVHPLIRALATDIISFQQTEPRDIEWLSEVIGEQANDVINLAPYHYIHWNDKDGTQFQGP